MGPDKINTIAREIYRASEATADKGLTDQLKKWEDEGYSHLPVCMAKPNIAFQLILTLKARRRTISFQFVKCVFPREQNS